MASKTISVRLNEELAAKLDQLSALAQRPKSWLIERMIEDYIDEELRQVAAIREQLDDDEGELIDHEVVMAEMDRLLREKLGDAVFEKLLREEETQKR